MTAPVVPLERGYCNDSAERWANRTMSQPSQNNGVSYQIYIYLHVCTTHNSSRVSASTSRHPNIDSPTSSYRHTARSVAVRHTSWLRPLRPFPQTRARSASATASPLRGSNSENQQSVYKLQRRSTWLSRAGLFITVAITFRANFRTASQKSASTTSATRATTFTAWTAAECDMTSSSSSSSWQRSRRRSTKSSTCWTVAETTWVGGDVEYWARAVATVLRERTPERKSRWRDSSAPPPPSTLRPDAAGVAQAASVDDRAATCRSPCWSVCNQRPIDHEAITYRLNIYSNTIFTPAGRLPDCSKKGALFQRMQNIRHRQDTWPYGDAPSHTMPLYDELPCVAAGASIQEGWCPEGRCRGGDGRANIWALIWNTRTTFPDEQWQRRSGNKNMLNEITL